MHAQAPYRLLFVGNGSNLDRFSAALAEAAGEFEITALDERSAVDESVAGCIGVPGPDAIVVDGTVANPLSAAGRLRRMSPRSQVVFLLPPERIERFRAGLPFVPHLGSAWTLDAEKADGLPRVLREAGRTARERAAAATVLSRINWQLSAARAPEAEVRRSQLALSERYLATLLSQSPDAFLAVDDQGALIAWNEAAKRLFGMDLDEALHTPVVRLFPQAHQAWLERLIEDTRRDGKVLHGEVPLGVDGDGAPVHGEISVAPVHDEAGRVASVSITARDVTARRRADDELRELNRTLEARIAAAIAEREQVEEALRQAQKMEAVGQLTGGIAHDFNNMLAVVIGSLDLLARRIGSEDARTRRYVDAATEGARRAALLTQRLLAFSRQQPLRPQPINANKLVANMAELVRRSLGGDIRLETVLAGGLWRAHADPNQLESAILNLAVNARDAMPGGGRLTIETQNAHLDSRYTATHPGINPGQYVLIAVTDTGEGMSPEVIARAFDPFFTTKDVGKGTGLGLSQVYGFVRQSGGHVKIYSEPGYGTTVKIYLPRSVAEGEPAADDASADAPLGEQQELVLVVEDEPAVRQFSVDALCELGYRVLEADGATSALRQLEAHPDIALLFTDVVMPEVNGPRLADEARRRRPGLKVLFTTGYPRDAVVHNGVLGNAVDLLGKPFTVEELAAKVREVLDTPSADES
ncbi:hybrid sensor histidine kinase/response regulator [Coralloluteibacterium thermophilus]|uniref:histidine kinase n=1 Tax=Coralloluteibacterium thermophilum TaxID=2707049 RepID=A0ABV9NGZ5_9GAMM